MPDYNISDDVDRFERCLAVTNDSDMRKKLVSANATLEKLTSTFGFVMQGIPIQLSSEHTRVHCTIQFLALVPQLALTLSSLFHIQRERSTRLKSRNEFVSGFKPSGHKLTK
jgi:hypothetical protein